MANKFAVVNGNFNATSTWSDTPAGAAGASVPVAGDNAYANGKIVTITADATCTKISNEAENSATVGGYFILNAGVILNANVICGSTVNACLLAQYSSPNISTINGNINGGTGNQNTGGIYASGTGRLNINGNITAGSTASTRAIQVQNAMTINIVGSVTATTAAHAIYVNNFAAIINITGAITAVTGYGVDYQTNYGSLTITGNVYGGTGSASHGINITGVAPVNITGNVYGGTGANAHGLSVGAVSGLTMTINGNVYGGDTSTNIGGQGISYGATSGSTLTVNGAAYGMKYTNAIYNSSSGTVKVVRAVGSSYGPAQNVGGNAACGVYSNVYNSISYVEEIQYGSNGMTPTYGPILITPKSTNVALFTKSDLTQKTLYDATNVTGALPAASDVRYGVVYNYSANSGTCRVPAASSVAYGVLVDNTTGTAILTASAIWDSLTSTMTTSGSIGERLKNVSTIASTSQQLADALSA